MLKTCNKCGNSFETKRKDKLFCSDKCRMASSRNVTQSVTDGRNVTEDIVTDRTREFLIQSFRDDDKTKTEINDYMENQDKHFERFGRYFIPARFQQQYNELMVS